MPVDEAAHQGAVARALSIQQQVVRPLVDLRRPFQRAKIRLQVGRGLGGPEGFDLCTFQTIICTKLNFKKDKGDMNEKKNLLAMERTRGCLKGVQVLHW